MSDLLGNPFPTADISLGLLWAISVGVIFWYVGRVATQITYETLPDGQQRIRPVPLAFRLLMPFSPNIRIYTGPKYRKTREKIQGMLTGAGYENVLTLQQFLSMKVLMPVFLAPVYCLLVYLFINKVPGPISAFLAERQGFIYLILVMYCFVYPGMWLKRVLRMRHRSIERSLPFVLDLLTLSVEAGLDFISAMKRIVEGKKMDDLNEELLRSMREMQVGRTRKEALKDMAERMKHKDISSLVNALVQADELGVSIGSILRIQADQMRIRRFQRAEKMGNEAPVKLLFPLVVFIFPSVFLVLLGPIFLELMRKGF